MYILLAMKIRYSKTSNFWHECMSVFAVQLCVVLTSFAHLAYIAVCCENYYMQLNYGYKGHPIEVVVLIWCHRRFSALDSYL